MTETMVGFNSNRGSFIVLILLSSVFSGCLGESDYEDSSSGFYVQYSVDCECDLLYAEYNTEYGLEYGYQDLEDGIWHSELIYYSGSESIYELYLYAADDDEDNEYTSIIGLITVNGEVAASDIVDGFDPDVEIYYYV